MESIASLVTALAAVAALLVGVAVLLEVRRLASAQQDSTGRYHQELSDLRQEVGNLRQEVATQQQTIGDLSRQLTGMAASDEQRHNATIHQLTTTTAQMSELRRDTTQQLGQNRENVEGRLDKMRDTVDHQLGAMREAVNQQLGIIRADNAQQLEQIRATVDEKLQKTLNDRITQSFQMVNNQLAEVGRGLGEMQSLATDVGGLKRLLSGVKTRGIMGEVQLGSILSEILSPAQYEENVATVPGSTAYVEFAVKLPAEDDEVVWLPIDSKFPGDAYEHLRDAQDSGDSAAVDAAWKDLQTRIKAEAKDIHDKYLAPPATTTFGIMFLPSEGLYAEIAGRSGLLDELQRTYRVNVAGPSTMAALLNSLQMGFQTVAIQKRATEVQEVLAAVKAEFNTYQGRLQTAKRQLNTASKTVDELLGARTNKMNKALSSITELDDLDAAEHLLGIDSAESGSAENTE